MQNFLEIYVSDPKKPTKHINSCEYPILSICVPSYNRKEKLLVLVRKILTLESNIELCVHVDGSSDGSLEELLRISDIRLHVSSSVNLGRANALLAAIRNSQGRYIMLFDDDDDIDINSLQNAIQRCREELPYNIAGFIYNMNDENGYIIGKQFPTKQSNFIKIRADEGVTGDKKEIVRSVLLKELTYDPHGTFRRVPTSLCWARIALKYDVLCFNESLGVKHYLPGGMTSNIIRTKIKNAYPMHLLYRVQFAAYLYRRYSNVNYFLRAMVGVIAYGLLALKDIGKVRIP